MLSSGPNSVAICISNYRMPEQTNALVEHIEATTTWPHQYFIIDTGYDGDCIKNLPHSKYSMFAVLEDLQMNKTLMMEVAAAKRTEFVTGEKFLAYWFITTSMNFHNDNTDILHILASWLLENPRAVQLSPALDTTSGTAWTNMLTRGGNGWRKTFGMDALATMYRADWFNSVGGYDPDLKVGWGMDMELSWKARRDGMTSWISEDCLMHKERSIAYKMGRWNETPLERETAGRAEMDRVLGAKYSPDYIQKLMWEFTTPDMGGM